MAKEWHKWIFSGEWLGANIFCLQNLKLFLQKKNCIYSLCDSDQYGDQYLSVFGHTNKELS